MTGQKVVLHVGCGEYSPERLFVAFRGPDWRELRLDADPAVKPDIVARVEDMAPVPASSVQAVFASHVLEHLYPHQVERALSEFHRVLAPGGQVLLIVPDLKAVARMVLEDRLEETAYTSPAGPISPIDMLFGWRPALAAGNEHMAHKTGFTAASLVGALQRARFVVQKAEEAPRDFSLWAMGRKPE